MYRGKIQNKAQKSKNQQGQVMILTAIFFMILSLILISGFGFSTLEDAHSVRRLFQANRSYFLAEAGVEDLVYRVVNARTYDSSETVSLDGYSADVTVSDNIVTGEKEVLSSGDIDGDIRKVITSLKLGTGVSFNYGVQVGDGGMRLDNSSQVLGNIYSNGPVIGQNNNLINGDAVSAGSSGLIKEVHIANDAYANTIQDSIVDRDAYYQNIANTTVAGTQYPGSPDPPVQSFPVSDSMISDWEAIASANIITSPCPYVIDSNTTIGPVKIECDLKIKNNPTVTLGGMIWVQGNIEIENSPTIRLDPSLGAKSVAIIADNPADRQNSSKVELKNSIQFANSGIDGSYIMIVSMNNDAETGGATEAIELENSVSGEYFIYAPHGKIEISNSANVKQITGYEVHLKNSAQVTYETGLASILFDTGPGGSLDISKWQETP